MRRDKGILGKLAGAMLFSASPAFAEGVLNQPSALADCAAIAGDVARLACYDGLAAGERRNGAGDNFRLPENNQRAVQADRNNTRETLAQPVLPSAARLDSLSRSRSAGSAMSRHWELDPGDKQGIFNFREHRDNYLVASYNSAPNEAPYQPFRQITSDAGKLSNSELSFQLGFKVKLLQEPGGAPLDLWFGYTQRSFWQAQNQEASSPFRETDYQPELMAVVPTDINLLGLRMRFLNFGIAHQSNGQVSTLSRSWNRAYVQAGFERGDFTLLARAWKRFNEDRDTDDNPDIVDYMGRGDLLASYRWGGNEASLLVRRNFSTGKGAAQLSWAFPLVSNLKGYVQYFNGYGYTLIDYDAYQKVLGLGLLIDF